MLWFFIIAVVAYFIIKFVIDNNKQANSVAKQGGMRNKYHALVQYALEGHPESKIVHEDGTSIRIGCSSAGGSTYMDIIQSFGSVIIQWNSHSLMIGNHELKWQFDEFKDQNEMIAQIEYDLSVYMSNVMSKYK